MYCIVPLVSPNNLFICFLLIVSFASFTPKYFFLHVPLLSLLPPCCMFPLVFFYFLHFCNMSISTEIGVFPKLFPKLFKLLFHTTTLSILSPLILKTHCFVCYGAVQLCFCETDYLQHFIMHLYPLFPLI